jgi:hypothetical protein
MLGVGVMLSRRAATRVTNHTTRSIATPIIFTVISGDSIARDVARADAVRVIKVLAGEN